SVLWNSPHYYYLMNDNTTGLSTGSILSRIDNSPDNTTAEIESEAPGTPMSDFQTLPVRGATSYWSGGHAGFVNNPHHNSDISSTATTTNLNPNSTSPNPWLHCT